MTSEIPNRASKVPNTAIRATSKGSPAATRPPNTMINSMIVIGAEMPSALPRSAPIWVPMSEPTARSPPNRTLTAPWSPPMVFFICL